MIRKTRPVCNRFPDCGLWMYNPVQQNTTNSEQLLKTLFLHSLFASFIVCLVSFIAQLPRQLPSTLFLLRIDSQVLYSMVGFLLPSAISLLVYTDIWLYVRLHMGNIIRFVASCSRSIQLLKTSLETASTGRCKLIREKINPNYQKKSIGEYSNSHVIAFEYFQITSPPLYLCAISPMSNIERTIHYFFKLNLSESKQQLFILHMHAFISFYLHIFDQT